MFKWLRKKNGILAEILSFPFVVSFYFYWGKGDFNDRIWQSNDLTICTNTTCFKIGNAVAWTHDSFVVVRVLGHCV